MLINANQIFLEKSLTDRDDILKFIASEAKKLRVVTNEEAVFAAFIKREEYSTAVQEGIAIPHAKSDIVKTPKLFFVRMQEAVEWNSPEGYQVKVIFAILVPEKDASTKYLEIIANLAGNLLEEDFQEQIFEARDKETILNLLKAMGEETD